jgi:hypothetical protein
MQDRAQDASAATHRPSNQRKKQTLDPEGNASGGGSPLKQPKQGPSLADEALIQWHAA